MLQTRDVGEMTVKLISYLCPVPGQLSIDAQRSAIRAFCDAHEHEIDEEYVDTSTNSTNELSRAVSQTGIQGIEGLIAYNFDCSLGRYKRAADIKDTYINFFGNRKNFVVVDGSVAEEQLRALWSAANAQVTAEIMRKFAD